MLEFKTLRGVCAVYTHQSQKANHSFGDFVSGKSLVLKNRSKKAYENRTTCGPSPSKDFGE